ncbi:hypothetical protein DPEC_G00242620 [Dallia pectoralis]|uniref:Uncharacterized protein n=1 Tax=Dallia pectoralis TaxID=75939 RepID=A0ACC2FVD0_DALPE|nr:hypothetical protein DPEC_G00242620 [Dallia pectoralis]
MSTSPGYKRWAGLLSYGAVLFARPPILKLSISLLAMPYGSYTFPPPSRHQTRSRGAALVKATSRHGSWVGAGPDTKPLDVARAHMGRWAVLSGMWKTQTEATDWTTTRREEKVHSGYKQKHFGVLCNILPPFPEPENAERNRVSEERRAQTDASGSMKNQHGFIWSGGRVVARGRGNEKRDEQAG